MGNIITNSNERASNEQPNKDLIPWWLFLNVLALDAPIVAIVWQHFLAKNFKIEIIPVTKMEEAFASLFGEGQ